MKAQWHMYINGEFCDAESGRTAEVLNPATEEVIAEVPYGDTRDASRALSAAAGAFDAWRRMNAWDRAKILRRAADLMRERAEDMARTMSAEVGKPVPESLGEILASANYFEWFAEEGKRVYGRWVPASKDGVRRWVLRQPVGVCAAISAWNFPVLLPVRKIAAAVGAGCTIVARPSVHAPLASLEMIACLHDAGFPPGVVNCVLGPGREMAVEFLGNPLCRKLSFTGSTEVGKELIRGSAEHVTKLSLELGGSAPVLVFPDVDVAQVAEANTRGKFRNNGQVCIAATRFYVHESIYEEYVARVVEVASGLRMGNPLDADGEPVPGVDCGPLYSASAVENAEDFVEDAVEGGAEVLVGGGRPDGPEFRRGYWFLPTVLVDVPAGARLTCEEVFGPIMPIFPFSTTEEAIRLANNTVYGLAGYVFTRDLHRAIEVAEELEFGIIGLNDMVPATAEAPFGGVKQSGLGREGAAEGIEAYVEVKYVSVGGG